MSSGFGNLLRRRPGRSVLTLFTLTILLPGLVLAAFSLRILEQEHQLALRDIDSRLDAVSREAAKTLDEDLRELQSSFARIARTAVVNPSELPAVIRQAAETPGNLAIAIHSQTVWPEHSVAYLPWDRAAPLESHDLNASDHPGRRAQSLNAEARAAKQRGDEDSALRRFRELVAAGAEARVGSVPADLVGRYGICELAEGSAVTMCASALHRDLARGVWLLDKPLYLYYRGQAEQWLRTASPAAPDLAHDRALDAQRRALADAIASADPVGSAGVLLIRVPVAGPDPGQEFRGAGDGVPRHTVTVAMWRGWVRDHLWPRLVRPSRSDFEAALAEVSGTGVQYAAGSYQASASVRSTRHTFGDAVWRLDVRPRDMDALLAPSAQRRTVYITLLAGGLLLLAFGTYFTSRVVRQELEVARMKSEFVSAVSHEFRSPLTGIRQLSEMLARGRVPNAERRQQYYERIAGESDRLARVVENILDFSRMEADRRAYEFELLETSGWLEGLVPRFERTVARTGHQLERDIPRVAPVLGDREALTTALDNLVDNALKYSPDADRVCLSAEDRGSSVVLRVQDFGVGIDPADRPHLFERFYRGRGEITREVPGTGLGLSLVDHIVRAHRGRIEVSSRPGEGSTFSIILPAAPAPPTAQVSAS